jgi:hypothetical protein
MKFNPRVCFSFLPVLVGFFLFTGLIGCSSPKSSEQPAQQPQAPTRYSLSGRVVSVDKGKQQVVIDAGDIPGFMSAMTMGYSVKNTSLLEGISPEEQITADVMVNGNDVWLENIVVAKKPDQSKAPASKEAQPASSQPSKN